MSKVANYGLIILTVTCMYVMQVYMFGWFLIILIQNISSQQTLPDFWQSMLHMECYLLVLMQIDIFNTSLSCLLDLSLPIFPDLHLYEIEIYHTCHFF